MSVTSHRQRHYHKPHADGDSDASCRQAAARSSCRAVGGTIFAPVVTSPRAWHWRCHKSHIGAGVTENLAHMLAAQFAWCTCSRPVCVCTWVHGNMCACMAKRCLPLHFPPGRQMKKFGDPCDTEFAVSIFNNFTVRICCQILKSWQI